MKKLFIFLLLGFLYVLAVVGFEISHFVASGVLAIVLYIIFSYMYYRYKSYEYRNKPVRKYFVYLFSILFFPIVISYFALRWLFDINGLQSMYHDYEPLEYDEDWYDSEDGPINGDT